MRTFAVGCAIVFSLIGSGAAARLAPAPAPGPAPGPAPSAAPDVVSGPPINCTAFVDVSKPWPQKGTQGGYATSINFQIANYNSYTTDVPWSFAISNPNYTAILPTPWNWNSLSITGDGVITGDAKQVWEALSPGASVNLGCIVGGAPSAAEDFVPKTAKVNGHECRISLKAASSDDSGSGSGSGSDSGSGSGSGSDSGTSSFSPYSAYVFSPPYIPSPSPSPSPSLSRNSSASPSPSDSGRPSALTFPSPSPTPNKYTPSRKAPTPAPDAEPTTYVAPAPGPGHSPRVNYKCAVNVSITQPWPLSGPDGHVLGSDSTYETVLNFRVTNLDSSTVSAPWSFSVSNSNYKAVEPTPWNWVVLSIKSGNVAGTASQSYQSLSQGGSANLGLIMGGDVNTTAAFVPKSAKLNGQECQIRVTE